MSLNIKDDEAHRLAQQLARLTRYALTKPAREPLLLKVNDFNHTDIEAVKF